MKTQIICLCISIIKLGFVLSLQAQTKWQNGKEGDLVEIDFNKKETFEKIELQLTEVGSLKFQKIKLKIANTEVDIDKRISESIASDQITLDIKGYLGEKWETVSNFTEPKQLNVEITSENNESMKFAYKITPAKTTLPAAKSNEFTPIPFPVFSYSFDTAGLGLNKKHRILLIDGTPRNNMNGGISLKKADLKNPNKLILVDAKALISGRSLSVFTKNISLRDLEYIKISVSGNDYIFNAGVSDLFDLALALGPEAATDTTAQRVATGETKKDEKDQNNREYFTSILDTLKKVTEMTIEDYKALQRYQSVMLDSIKGKRLDPTSLSLASKIVSFTPKYLNITTFPLTIPNNDEVTISTEVRYKGGQPNSTPSGTYKTTGALSVNVGSAVYLTGLKNNNVYTEPLKVDGQPDQLRARIDDDDQLSVGVGINSEITYRTGSIFRPSVSLGFFVPFEEDITPYLAIGPGFALIDSKVSFSFSYGFAFGKINSINERYRDVDLNTIPNFSELNIIQKVWSKSWYIGIGVGFNLSSQD